MNFPIIERRKTTNRRGHSPDRRREQNSYFFQNEQRDNSERRNETDRRVLELDRNTLLFSIKQSEINAPTEKKSKVISFCSAILIPLSIGISSFLIAINQDKNAQRIANGQQENAQKIASANIENSQKIADAQIETQHLQHLVSIFSTIISPKDEKKSIIHQRIRSLAVYGGEALPFLLQIRQHFSSLNSTASKNTEKVANLTIAKILGYSQLDLQGQKVIGKPEKPINLRHKKYKNYNLDNSRFEHVNLYKADFSGSSLHASTFTHADLQETNFGNANLLNVKFKDSNLSKSDFRRANLKNVEFLSNCKNIKYAKFSLRSLLNASVKPFISLPSDTYAFLLMAHKNKLERINNEEIGKLDDAFKKLEIKNFRELQDKFIIFRNEGWTGVDKKPGSHLLSLYF